MANEDHLSLGKIAKQCNVSRTTVYRWIVNGHLNAYSLPSGHYRVRPEDLAEFRKTFNIPETRQAGSESQHAVERKKLDVLIADDHQDMVLVLRRVVERYLPEATIHEALNGVDTCISVGTIKPQLVLLDIMMPGMDGFAVLEELLQRDELAGSKIIIVSAYEPFDRVHELSRAHEQVAECMHKPISVEQLGEHIQRIADGFLESSQEAQA